MRLVVPGQSCRAAHLFRNGWSRHEGFWDTSTDKNNGMQDSHTDPLVIISFFFLIENKDSDISTEPSQTPDSQAYWKLYGGRTTPKLTALRGLKPFQHISFHNKPYSWGHNTSHIYIISSSTPFHYKCMCFWFKTIQGKKRKRKFVVRRHSTPLWPNLLQNEVLTSEQQHTLQYGTSIGEMT